MAGIALALGVTVACGGTGQDAQRRATQEAAASAQAMDELPQADETGDAAAGKESGMQQAAEENGLPDYLQGVDLTGAAPVEHEFSEVSVHDPSVIKAGDSWYVFGSHLAAARSDDLMHWTLLDSGVHEGNVIIPDAKQEMKEAFEWAKTDTFWAPDVIRLPDGRYYMYYCNCEGSSPLSALGIAVAKNVEGPYEDLGIILKSGQDATTPDEDGEVYDATVKPNAVDPCVFFDKEGRLWMVYGSYSGGIYILELDAETGFPLESGYGKKLLGGNHLRIEAPYILYSPDTDYYYLFLSFGGLAADGGYNIRVCRSKQPDGPYLDTEGQDMIDCKGPVGSFFDDSAASKYGAKLMGNFTYPYVEGENGKFRFGYVSPGHNSAYYEEETGEYFLFFHTRFEQKGEEHQVRVHRMFFNEDGWPVVSPYRYVGKMPETVEEDKIPGPYKLVNHMHHISSVTQAAEDILLHSDHTVTGSYKGTWEMDEAIWTDYQTTFFPSLKKAEADQTDKDKKYGQYFDDYFDQVKQGVIPFGDCQIPGFAGFVGAEGPYAGVEDSVFNGEKNANDWVTELTEKANEYNRQAMEDAGLTPAE